MAYLIRDFTFNGVDKPDWLLISKTIRNLAPARSAVLGTAAKRAGAFLYGFNTEVRVIKFDVTIMADDDADLWKKGEWLIDWLETKEPAELIINDEPDRTYYAILTDEMTPDVMAAMGSFTLNFICPDPYKYGQEYTQDLLTQPIVLNDANAPLTPNFTVTYKAEAAYLAIINGNEEYFLLGEPENVEKTKLARSQLSKGWALDTTTGWAATGTRVESGSAISGTMASNGNQFYASSYGTGSAWHGPAMKASLPAPLDNYRVEVNMRLQSSAKGQMGKNEVFGLDANGKIIFKFTIADRTVNYELNQVYIELGETTDRTYLISSYGKKKYDFNDFYGKFYLEKDGQKFTAYVGKWNSKKRIYEKVIIKTWTDTRNRYQEDITQIQLSTYAYGTKAAKATQHFESVYVYKINKLGATDTNVIFKPGDEVIVDGNTKAVYRNGHLLMHYMALESDWISLEPGDNPLIIDPIEAIDTAEISYRKRYK